MGEKNSKAIFSEKIQGLINLTTQTVEAIKKMDDYQFQMATFDKDFLKNMAAFAEALEKLKNKTAGLLLATSIQSLIEKKLDEITDPLKEKTIANPVQFKACQYIVDAIDAIGSDEVMGYVLNPKSVKALLATAGLDKKAVKNRITASKTNFFNKLEVYKKGPKGKEEESEEVLIPIDEERFGQNEDDLSASQESTSEKIGLVIYKTLIKGLRGEVENTHISEHSNLKLEPSELLNKKTDEVDKIKMQVSSDIDVLEGYEKELEELQVLQREMKKDPLFVLHKKMEAIFSGELMSGASIDELLEGITIKASSELDHIVAPYVESVQEIQGRLSKINSSWVEKKKEALAAFKGEGVDDIKNLTGLFSELIGEKKFNFYIKKLKKEELSEEHFKQSLQHDIDSEEKNGKTVFIKQHTAFIDDCSSLRKDFSEAVKSELGYNANSFNSDEKFIEESTRECANLKHKFDEVQHHIDAQQPLSEIRAHYEKTQEALQAFMDRNYNFFWKVIDKIADIFKIRADHKPAALQYYHQAKEIKEKIDEIYNDDVDGVFQEGAEVDDAKKLAAAEKWKKDIEPYKKELNNQTIKVIKRGLFTPHAKDAGEISDAVQKLGSDEAIKPNGGNMTQG